MEEESKAKAASEWEGKARVKLRGARAEEIWPFLEDFCNFHKWHPNITTCYQVEGNLGQPGLIRFISSNKNSLVWVKEKLVSIDPLARSLSYEIIDNNMGFGFYVATIKVLGVEEGCEIEWSFVCDPIHGWKLDDFVSYLKSTLEGIASKIQEPLPNT